MFGNKNVWNGDVFLMNDFNEKTFDDFGEKTVGAYDFSQMNLNSQNNNKTMNATPQVENVQPSSVVLVGDDFEEKSLDVFGETLDSTNTISDNQDDTSANYLEPDISEVIEEDDFEEKTVDMFSGVSGSIYKTSDKQDDISVNHQEPAVSKIFEEDDFDEKTVDIFGRVPGSADTSVNNEEPAVSEIIEEDFGEKTVSQKETINTNSKSNKTVNSSDKSSKKFLILAIVFLILAIVSLVFFPLAIVFAILDVVFFVKYFKAKNKNNK